MSEVEDLLLGRIIERSGLATSAQIAEALAAQAESPGRPLGEILVERGHLSTRQLEDVLAIQNRKFETPRVDNTKVRLKDSLFGQLVQLKKYARAGDVHECLRLQQKLKEHGEHLLLGELLVLKSRMSASQVAAILREQDGRLLFCESCLRRVEVPPGQATTGAMRCDHCGATLREPTPIELARDPG